MKNKKGFTLIELLAVIIILGVLMLVAIPSVTSYINNSRKSAYADTAANYIKGATNLVNEGQKVQCYDENTLYMIPVGHNKDVSCVALESGGQSPYNTTYKMAYVGVVYHNESGSYDYYFTSVDGSGQGFKFNSSYKISSSKDGEGSALVEAGLGNYASALQSKYSTISEQGVQTPPASAADYESCKTAAGTCSTESDTDLAAMLTTAGANRLYVYATANCK